MTSIRALRQRLEGNLAEIRRRIRDAQLRSTLAAEQVEVVVVTKSAPAWLFPHLAAVGVRAVGENRVQAVAERKPLAPKGWIWHGIGHLQRNKAQTATALFDVFHALDSLRLAERLEACLAPTDRTWPVYVQVNAARDPAKGGPPPEDALAFLQALAPFPHLEPVGFMTMARQGGSEDDARSTFRTLRALRDQALRLDQGRASPSGLSMGMTDDFELAVEEGATVVRVGRVVFEGIDLEREPQTREVAP